MCIYVHTTGKSYNAACTVHRAERGMCSIFEVAVVAMQQQRSNNTRDDGDETQDQIKPNHSSQQQNSGVAADQ